MPLFDGEETNAVGVVGEEPVRRLNAIGRVTRVVARICVARSRATP